MFRPVVPVTVGGLSVERAPDGLVDSGSESTLVAGWVADLVGVDLSRPDEVLSIGVGGSRVEARFVQVELRFSHRCNARWARSTQLGGDFPADVFAALGSGFVTRQTEIGRVWSLMWTGPIRACGGLVPLQSGFRACTVAR